MISMDHEVVARQKMTERYLLNELDSETRDQFEEHFFDCAECALDVRAGSAFVEESKAVLAESPALTGLSGRVLPPSRSRALTSAASVLLRRVCSRSVRPSSGCA